MIGMMNLERYVAYSKEQWVVKWLSQLSNHYIDPFFEAAIEYLIQGDPFYSLGIDFPGTFAQLFSKAGGAQFVNYDLGRAAYTNHLTFEAGTDIDDVNDIGVYQYTAVKYLSEYRGKV
nr:ORF1 [Picobirnavirus sp.]